MVCKIDFSFLDSAAHLTIEGVLTSADLARLYIEFGGDRRRCTEQNVFCDMSRVEDVDLTFQQVLGMVHSRSDFYKRCKNVSVGVWAPSDLAYGMARMYVTLLSEFEGIDAGVFRDRELAMEHIGSDVATTRN